MQPPRSAVAAAAAKLGCGLPAARLCRAQRPPPLCRLPSVLLARPPPRPRDVVRARSTTSGGGEHDAAATIDGTAASLPASSAEVRGGGGGAAHAAAATLLCAAVDAAFASSTAARSPPEPLDAGVADEVTAAAAVAAALLHAAQRAPPPPSPTRPRTAVVAVFADALELELVRAAAAEQLALAPPRPQRSSSSPAAGGGVAALVGGAAFAAEAVAMRGHPPPALVLATPGRLQQHLSDGGECGGAAGTALRGASLIVLVGAERLLQRGSLLRPQTEQAMRALRAPPRGRPLPAAAAAPPPLAVLAIARTGSVVGGGVSALQAALAEAPGPPRVARAALALLRPLSAQQQGAVVVDDHDVNDDDDEAGDNAVAPAPPSLVTLVTPATHHAELLHLVTQHLAFSGGARVAVVFRSVPEARLAVLLFRALRLPVMEAHGRKPPAHAAAMLRGFASQRRAVLFTTPGPAARAAAEAGATLVVTVGLPTLAVGGGGSGAEGGSPATPPPQQHQHQRQRRVLLLFEHEAKLLPPSPPPSPPPLPLPASGLPPPHLRRLLPPVRAALRRLPEREKTDAYVAWLSAHLRARRALGWSAARALESAASYAAAAGCAAAPALDWELAARLGVESELGAHVAGGPRTSRRDGRFA